MSDYDIYEGEKLVAVRKNNQGDIVAFKTSMGRELDYEMAIDAVRTNYVTGVNLRKGTDGQVYIRANADGNPDNDLDNLPTF